MASNSAITGRDSISYYTAAIWNALYEYGADLVLNGHDHAYQRFAPQRPDGTRDDTHGVRQIAVGTGGGETLYDFNDANEQSPVIHTATLRAEVAGGPSKYAPGQSIPDHLRAGIYQDPSYNCPGGCSVGVDNVQVVKA